MLNPNPIPILAAAVLLLAGVYTNAHAGALDQGPHQLVVLDRAGLLPALVLDVFGDKSECLAVRDGLLAGAQPYSPVLVCSPVRRT